jgi:hypothetical protein
MNTTTIPKVGSRWMIRYGYETFAVKILSAHAGKVAWQQDSESAFKISSTESLEYFLNSYRCAVLLPDPPLPWWKRIF